MTSTTRRWSIKPIRWRALCEPETLPVSSLTQMPPLGSKPRLPSSPQSESKAAGRTADARDLLRRAVAIDPRNPGSHYNLAVVADEGGERAVAIDRGNVDAAYVQLAFMINAPVARAQVADWQRMLDINVLGLMAAMFRRRSEASRCAEA